MPKNSTPLAVQAGRRLAHLAFVKKVSYLWVKTREGYQSEDRSYITVHQSLPGVYRLYCHDKKQVQKVLVHTRGAASQEWVEAQLTGLL